MTSRVTRFGHSCVRVERDGDALVIDPGVLSDLDAALEGVRDVLVTHEHADHVDVARLASSDVDITAPQPVLDALAAAGAPAERLHPVVDGDHLDVHGFEVRVLGEKHAVVHPDLPVATNVGYLVDGVLHPGDAYVDPQGHDVRLLLVPIGGPWLKISEVVDYVRRVSPPRTAAIHDAHLSPAGVALVKTVLDGLAKTDLVVLAPGEGIDV